MATHSSIPALRILWTEEPGGLLSVGSHRVGHDWSDLAYLHTLEKEMATHSSILAWRIPGTEEPGGLLSMGLHRVGHDWSDLAAAAAKIILCTPSGTKSKWVSVVHTWPLGQELVWKDLGQGILAVVIAIAGNSVHAFHWRLLLRCSFFPVFQATPWTFHELKKRPNDASFYGV